MHRRVAVCIHWRYGCTLTSTAQQQQDIFFYCDSSMPIIAAMVPIWRRSYCLPLSQWLLRAVHLLAQCLLMAMAGGYEAKSTNVHLCGIS